MRSFLALFLTLPLVFIIGCDGDGDGGEGGGTTADADTAAEPVDSTPATMILDSGTEVVPDVDGRLLAELMLEEPGMLEGRVEWSGDPETMEVQFQHVASGTRQTVVSGSPAYVYMHATDDLLDQPTWGLDESWWWLQANSDISVEVEYIVRFTPD